MIGEVCAKVTASQVQDKWTKHEGRLGANSSVCPRVVV